MGASVESNLNNVDIVFLIMLTSQNAHERKIAK